MSSADGDAHTFSAIEIGLYLIRVGSRRFEILTNGLHHPILNGQAFAWSCAVDGTFFGDLYLTLGWSPVQALAVTAQRKEWRTGQKIGCYLSHHEQAAYSLQAVQMAIDRDCGHLRSWVRADPG
ncbi:hypothetical protein N183_32605 [Sinorhizobium sp. Sb3]|uniref:hypothetical protein n=1 Tax=Sinorhizobium sp. Sb3 TaxID=1358417 RepID=UPI00071C79A5|nr:hypothetical protein [Sinorhizobium sp. Sb3]KSV66997.1 hypothetical protein N183_32605 [Sinorhizobium sp. Sb3]